MFDPGLEGVSTKLSVRVRGGNAGLAAADSGERTGLTFWASLGAGLGGSCTGGDPDDVTIDRLALSFNAGDEASLKVLLLFGSMGGPDTALDVSEVLLSFGGVGPNPGRATPALPPNFRSPSSIGASCGIGGTWDCLAGRTGFGKNTGLLEVATGFRAGACCVEGVAIGDLAGSCGGAGCEGAYHAGGN